MNKTPLILLAIVICLLPCVQTRASVSGGCLMPCAVFDEVLAQAKADPKLRWAALRLLRASAEGRAMEIDAETLQPFRILEEAVDAGEMRGENSRVAAFLAIGRLGSPAAREYLDAITKDQFAEAEREALWRSVQIARYEWKLATIPDLKRRVDFLASILRARRENIWEWAPEGWALDQLCSIGDIDALPELEAAIQRNLDATQRDKTLRLCKDIAYLASSRQDRVAALSGALRIDETSLNEPLLIWVIAELGRMRTNESRAALEKFVQSATAKGSARAPGDPASVHILSARRYLRRLTK